MTSHLISLMIFLPIIGALLQAFFTSPSSQQGRGFSAGRVIAMGASLSSSIFGLFLVSSMQGQFSGLSIQETFSWIGSYAITYDIGLDGLNAMLVLLISVVFPLLIASEWNQKIGDRGLYGLLLVLQASFLGTVCSQDLFLLFFFWALSAFPFYFLLGIWGSDERQSAAFRAIVSASIGNALLFSALILVYYALEPHTFSIKDLAGGRLGEKTFVFLGGEFHVSTVAFLLTSAGLALRAPIWPFQGWFTQFASQSTSAVFIALSAVSVPVATYIFTRLSYSLFPETIMRFSSIIVVVGMINLVIGGICALAQRSLRLLAAFICMSEVGLILIGIGSLNPTAVVGAIYHELVLGLGLAGFGLFTGVLFERSGTVEFRDENGAVKLGGIANFAPQMALVAGIVIASLLGIPGSGGFVSHALLMIGSYTIHPLVVITAALIFIFFSFFLFKMYRFVFLGSAVEHSPFADLTLRERAFFLPLVGGVLVFGVYPKPLIELVRPTVMGLLANIK